MIKALTGTGGVAAMFRIGFLPMLATSLTLSATVLMADTLELVDRSLIEGRYIGGNSGARTGAKVGVGASILTSGNSINIPAGTLVETNLRTPLTLQ